MRAFVVLAVLMVAAGVRAEQCDRAADGFAGVRVVGSFASDRGCMWEAYVVGGKRYEIRKAGALLERSGWREASARVALAGKYVRGVMLGRGVVIDAVPKELAGKLAPPRATVDSEGSVRFVAWRVLPAGMRPGTRYGRLEVTFGSDGDVRDVRTTSTVDAP